MRSYAAGPCAYPTTSVVDVLVSMVLVSMISDEDIKSESRKAHGQRT